MDNCVLKNGYVKTTLKGEALKAMYSNLLRMCLDGTMPITKIIGFSVKSDKHLETTVLNRSVSLLENQIEISSNLSKLIFTGLNINQCMINIPAGRIYAKDLVLPARRVKVEDKVVLKHLKIINADTYLFTATEDIQLDLYLNKASGAFLIKDNVKQIKTVDTKYYPLNSTHNLAPVIRFLPFDGYSIRYRLSKGISEDNINEIILDY